MNSNRNYPVQTRSLPPTNGQRNQPWSRNNFYNNKKRQATEICETGNGKAKSPKKKKKPLSQNKPSKIDWTLEDAQKAIDVELEYNKRSKSKNNVLILKFPDLELSREIVTKFHPAIENVHFQHPSMPRYCFVILIKDSDADSVIKELNEKPFGQGYLSAGYKRDREEDHKVGPEDIDPLTLYVGNLVQEVVKKDLIDIYPKLRRLDIGFAKKLKHTGYAFVSFCNLEDSIEAFKNTHSKEMYSKSLIVRFRRLHGAIGMAGETKQPNEPSNKDYSISKEDSVRTPENHPENHSTAWNDAGPSTSSENIPRTSALSALLDYGSAFSDTNLIDMVDYNGTKKPLSQNKPSKRDWTLEDAQKAIDVELEYNKSSKSKNNSLILKFPDLELNREIVTKFHPAIENVHFQHPSMPRYCFVTLIENSDAESVIKELNEKPFGQGYLSAEYKRDSENDHNVGPEDIDPLTLYVGNLAQEIVIKDLIDIYPKQRRLDIGFAKKMKNTRYAFVSFCNLEDSIEAFKNTHSKEMYSKSLIVRFLRVPGTIRIPSESKQPNAPKNKDFSISEGDSVRTPENQFTK